MMNSYRPTLSALTLFALGAMPLQAAHAAVAITEVAPWASANSPVAADWFEVTNFGSAAVSLAGWKMDDNSNSFALAVALNGIASIAPGESVVFIEGATPNAVFLSNWFGANVPAGLQVGYYSGAGVGLSSTSDAVNLFDSSGALMTRVDFGASPAASPFATFDNAAGANNVTLSTLSAVGVHGAFVAANSAGEIGSPGLIAAVPEPRSLALMLAGVGLVARLARRSRR